MKTLECYSYQLTDKIPADIFFSMFLSHVVKYASEFMNIN